MSDKDKNTNSKVRKKKKFKKRYWLLIDLALGALILALLFYKPARYKPSDTIPTNNRQKEISPYLTNELLPELYNSAQRDEPFDLEIIQKGINETITRLKFPQEFLDAGMKIFLLNKADIQPDC